MFSAIFIDRPRLATVIAIVTTIAGLLSLLVIPIAQYPDIVPPQVSVTTSYPGASAGVVEATIAQPVSRSKARSDHCCDAWNKLEAQPWTIMSIGMRDWAHRF